MRLGGAGYLCQFKPNHLKRRDYSLDQIDVFAAYVIPLDVWYLIPAAMLLGARRLTMAMLSPVTPPVKKKCYRYECYREAWNLLTKSRSELVSRNADLKAGRLNKNIDDAATQHQPRRGGI